MDEDKSTENVPVEAELVDEGESNKGSEPGVDIEYPYPEGSLDAKPQWGVGSEEE